MKSDTDGLFKLHDLGFGAIYDNSTAYIQNLSISSEAAVFTTNSAMFQLNFQGIGLPHYAYDRVISLLLRAGFVNLWTNEPDLTCS